MRTTDCRTTSALSQNEDLQFNNQYHRYQQYEWWGWREATCREISSKESWFWLNIGIWYNKSHASVILNLMSVHLCPPSWLASQCLSSNSVYLKGNLHSSWIPDFSRGHHHSPSGPKQLMSHTQRSQRSASLFLSYLNSLSSSHYTWWIRPNNSHGLDYFTSIHIGSIFCCCTKYLIISHETLFNSQFQMWKPETDVPICLTSV